MAKLRIACVGTGYFSRFQYSAWRRMPDVEIVGIANRTRASANAFAAEYGIPAVFETVPEMLDTVRPDVLDIITPPETHAEAIEAACARGIAVICQKPFCRTLSEAEVAVARAAKAGVVLAVHENFRFQPWHQEARRFLRSGRLGQVYQITFRLRPGDGQGPEAYLSRQPYFQKMPRFLVHETAIHIVDVFRYLMGEVTGVYAALRRLNPAIAGEDAGIVLFDFANGARGVFDGNRLADHPAQNRRLTMGDMVIEGSAGTLSLDGDGRLFWRAKDKNDFEPIAYEWHNRDFGGDCVYLIQRHIIDHLTQGAPLSNSGQDYLTNIRIEEAIYASNASAQHVSL